MPKIAIITDIHGNVPALDAVLQDLHGQAPDEVLVGGDLVGRGPQGSDVVRRIRELGWPGVRGNHEDYLLGFRFDRVPLEWLETDEWAASRFMAAELDDADVEYIDALPFSITATTAPGLRLAHGTPDSNARGLGPWCSDEELERAVESVAEPLLVCGHTHRTMQRRLRRGLLVNAGAVGLPFNRDRRAQYVIVSEHGGRFSVEFRHVPYDVERTLQIYDSSGFLARGGITARLLRLEVIHAAPFLVPFLKWAEARRLPPESAQLEAFLDFYDPDEPMGTFLSRLEIPYR